MTAQRLLGARGASLLATQSARPCRRLTDILGPSDGPSERLPKGQRSMPAQVISSTCHRAN